MTKQGTDTETMNPTTLNTGPRVAMVNVWSDHNRGDAAIVHATCDAILRLYPDARIDLHNVVFGERDTRTQVVSHFGSFIDTPYRLYPALFPSMVIAEGVAKVSQAARLVYLIRSLLVLILARIRPGMARVILRRGEQDAYDALIAADCVVSKGGSYLLGNSWKSVVQVTMVMFPLVLAKLCGCRTALLGVSVGPARSRIASRVMAFWFRWVDCFVLREEDAYSTCARLGVPAERMCVLPDFAFLLKIHESVVPAAPALLAAVSGPTVAVTVRRWAFADLPADQRMEQEESYLHGVADALVEFNRRTGATVILVPQVVGPGRQGSDLEALDIVQRRLGDRVPVVRMPDDLDYAALSAIYANVDLLVGTRLHSVILGFGTPTVIIGYQGNKSIGTARLVGNETGFIHINSVNADALLEHMLRIWADRYGFRERASQTRASFAAAFSSSLTPILEQLMVKRNASRAVVSHVGFAVLAGPET